MKGKIMELKNKIDWQVKNLQECGLSIQATGRNEFHVIAADVTNFAYYWTKEEPKTFENTSKTGKKYFVLAWHFDNVSKWVSIPTFKKIVVEDWYLISLERKYTSLELIKELDQAAAGYDDVEPFIMKDDIYIKSVAKHNKDISKLNDAIAKNNTDLIEEEKEKIITENKAKRIADKKAHIEKISDWNAAANDDAMDDEDIEIATNESELKALDDKFAVKVGADCSNDAVKRAINRVYYVQKKVNLKKVIELLNNLGMTNQDILKTLSLIDCSQSNEDDTVYKDEDQLATAINFVYTSNFDK